ncbi:MAG TPA: DUF5076 domain-containing protein [Allosphingosinicella sp.]|nr:DUF5076 domain-containing protein [Allosphingosinicella sp.]
MFGKRSSPQPAGAIDLTDAAAELGDANEILRAFIPRGEDETINGIYIDPPESFTPFMFGILLADLVHHGAKAFAYKFGVDEQLALYEISNGLSAELADPTHDVNQAQPEDH